MIQTPASLDRIHTLWDELADFEAARIDEARDHLLAGLCRLVEAQNACWIGAVRMGEPVPGDPVFGWRPRFVYYLHPTRPLDEATREQIQRLEAGCVDDTTIRNVSLAGSFRANRLADLVPAEWFEGDYYRGYYLGTNHADAIWAGVPINEDAEIYFGFFRECGHPAFGVAECDTVTHVLRGLRWFHRQQMLGHGLRVGAAPLTFTERTVLKGLLRGESERVIAAALGQSQHTTHEYVKRIYRKYAVNNRAALLALWLGRGASS